jgi:hypothetical protein
MSIRLALCGCMLGSLVCVANDVDPGWIAIHGERYRAETGQEAYDLAEALQWEAARSYPAPDITVPMLDADGAQIGTARIVVDSSTMQAVAVVNSASPQRPWSEQRAAYLARVQARTAALAKAATNAEKARVAAAGAGNNVNTIRQQVEELARVVAELVEALK